MLSSSPPSRFSVPFASSAGAPYIRTVPIPSQIGIQGGAASMTDGFVPVNATPIAAGGVPPYEQDFNGLLLQITQNIQWQNAGLAFPFDSTFSTYVGGYPKGAMLASNPVGTYWISLIDNNSADPDAGGANWLAFDPTGMPSTGDMKVRPTAEPILGWIAANALTIGNASSGATGRANADTFNLFKWTWNNFSNTQCPVSGGRGANPTADFAANKTIQLLDLRGTAFIGMDTMGGASSTRLSGVPVVSGSATAPGSILGENLHSLVSGENGPHIHGTTENPHFHTYAAPQNSAGQTNGGPFTCTTGGVTTNTSSTVTGLTVNSSGSGTGHNTVPRSIIGTIYLKL